MFTLLYNALKVIGQLPQGDSAKTLSDFTDAGRIDLWAKEAMTLLVKTGTIGGTMECSIRPARPHKSGNGAGAVKFVV